MFPAQIKVVGQSKVMLKWDDSSETLVSLETLRKFCPCATCTAEKENRSKSYIPLFHSTQIKVREIIIVGNYAVGIIWEDGHNTGIYEFPFLKNLSEN
jgi:DUF971 family protein